jgi:Protein of unknown function (DUF1194)
LSLSSPIVDFCGALLQVLPVISERRVIDVLGEGMDNDGGDTPTARDRALALGVTINGLPTVGGPQYILGYRQRQVIGGPAAFLEPAEGMRSFRDAMQRKLLRKIGRAESWAGKHEIRHQDCRVDICAVRARRNAGASGRAGRCPSRL